MALNRDGCFVIADILYITHCATIRQKVISVCDSSGSIMGLTGYILADSCTAKCDTKAQGQWHMTRYPLGDPADWPTALADITSSIH